MVTLFIKEEQLKMDEQKLVPPIIITQAVDLRRLGGGSRDIYYMRKSLL
jgi:hypothetical protein